MGLLTLGTPLTWSETIPYIDYIKEHGIDQFINLYCKYKNREDAQLKWGDEIEYSIVKFDHANKKVRVSLHSDEILTQFDKQVKENKKNHKENLSLWAPEFGGYMIEGTPGAPYGSSLECIDVVEKNMLARRNEARKFLSNDEALLSITFPSIGAPDFTSPPVKIKAGQTSESIFFSDDAVNCHNKRYITLMSNVLQRRGERLYSNVPIFKDKNTMSPFKEHFPDEESNKNSIPDHIYVDHMGFGVGMCCLQVTFQTVNVNEARWLYDQLTPITPIMLALSASTPIFRSYLADVDSRWDVIADLCDDRTPDEKGEAPLKDNHVIINKRRYDSTDCYIHPDSAEFNDIPLELNKKSYEKLIKNGIDEHLAKHIAHIFIRDPLQVYRERLEQDDTKSMEHFETIQSSNWCNMRFKPPPIENPEIGWRVEFRATEIQLTDFENAAYCCFLVLLSRVLVSYNLSFLIPISQVTENMKRAQKRDAVHNQKFYFRNKLTKCSSSDENVQQVKNENCHGYEIDEMSINEIINGDGKEFVGLVPLIRQFLEGANIDVESLSKINRYLDLIQDRASGKIFTLAHWMRDFVRSHPEYQYDSHVGDTIVYDMIKKMNEITLGKKHDESLLGKAPPVVKPKDVENAVKKEQKPKLLCYEDALNGQKFANLEAEFH